MKRTLYISLISLCFAMNLTAQTKYNVLFIAVDDLGVFLDPNVQMPNFSRLVKRGMLFQQTYCQYALCSPSRTSVLSGKRPDATGVYDNNTNVRTVLGEGYRFLPEYFHDNGYHTEKWAKITCAFHSEISYDFYGTVDDELDWKVGKSVPYWWMDTTAATTAETRGGKWTSALAPRLIQPLTTPYFYCLGLSTHNPYVPTLEAWNRIGDNSVQELLPVDTNGTYTNIIGNGSGNIILPDAPADDTADIPAIAFTRLFNYTPYETQRMRHAYYAEALQLDDNLGVLLDQLDSVNLWDNTVVVLFSDHGQHFGEHGGLWLKVTLFEESLRVPFVICAPGKKTGICNKPVELVDLYATLAELCGLPVPAGQEGSSLVPLLENPDAPWKKAIFAQVLRRATDTNEPVMGRSVRTAQYHYNNWSQYGEELYNIKNDPYEYNNLAIDSANSVVLNRMRRLLDNGWEGALPPAYPLQTCYKDKDRDGYGISNDSIKAYFPPDGYVLKKGDCNDNQPGINPGAEENLCNGIDDNCDGRVDEGRQQATITPLGSLDICAAGSVILQANKGMNLQYQWRLNGIDIPGAKEDRYTAEITGRYRVVITTESGCSSTSPNVTVINSCGIASVNSTNTSSQLSTAATGFTLYPNPANNSLFVSCKGNDAAMAQLRVFDMQGRILVNTTTCLLQENKTYLLDVSHLKPGMYYLECVDGKLQKRINKFLIAR